jgi:hypothetical protein
VVYIMIVQDAHKVEARIRRKCGLEANTSGHEASSPAGGDEEGENGDGEGQSLLSPVDWCERDIDLELSTHYRNREEDEEPTELEESTP